MTGNDGLLALLGILNELNVPYMMVGSYSSNFYGIPRSTKDADLVFEFESSMLKEIGDRLPPELRFESQSFFEMVTATRKELLLIDDSDFQIELFHLSDDEFDQCRFQRRVKVELPGGVSVWMPRPEDVIVQKLRWAKGGARSKDFEDVVSVMKFQQQLDFAHIEHWCGFHGTLELLGKARAVAEG
jgi:hypothetical protein